MKTFIVVSVLLCIAGVALGRNGGGGGSYDVGAVKKVIKPLKFEKTARPPALEKYLEYYGLDIEHVGGTSPGLVGARFIEHMFGSFKSGGTDIVAHVFRPPDSKGTVMLVHGYYDHAGIMSKLIRELVTKGYTVVIYDQPGHGLSGGARADIGNFSEYVVVLKDFVRLCRAELKGPFHLVAHSMGSGVAIDYLLNDKETPFEKVVLMAPLIRSAAWHVSGIGHAMAGSVVDSVPRVFRRNSSDKQFLKFMKRDPLQTRVVPMTWLKALRAWNADMVKYKASDKPVRIIQGTKDTTVNWKHNVKLLKGKFTKADIVMVEKAGHQLMNESEELRHKTFEVITGYLGEVKP